MPTKYAPNGFAETRDTFAWALVTAPEFEGRFTLDEIFTDLEHGIRTVQPTLKDAERLRILEDCLQTLRRSKAAFLAKDKQAHQLLLDAQMLFRSVRRPKRRPGEDPRESAEDTVDD